MFFSGLSYGIWLHVTVTWDQNRRLATVFFNGDKKASKVAGAALSSYEIMNNSHSYYQIGSKKDGGETFHGLIRNLKVFKKVLSNREILTEEREVNGMFDCLLASIWGKNILIICPLAKSILFLNLLCYTQKIFRVQ